jgi:predicted ribosomally synthesized peptide with SipW-like signal peptide
LNRKKWIKASFALSAVLFVLWWALGTGATLAWFSDTDSVRNEFQIGLLNLDVNYKNDIVTVYTPLQGATKAFNDEALYEPGYTQVVYLEIENNGDVDFKYKVAVTVEKVTEGFTAWGEPIYLPNYLRCGMIFAESEAALREEVSQRLAARTFATQELGTWSEISPYTFEVGEDPHYAALIIFMPEEVGNAANYRGIPQPKVELGIKVFAQQANAPMQ